MRPNKQYFIVEIDLKEQRKRKELISGSDIVIADTYVDMKFYLQAGPILAIGDQAKAWFPEAKVGDILVFHHTIEDDAQRRIFFDEVNEIEHRVVQCHADEVYGIQKLNATLDIIPSKPHIWCKEFPKENKDVFQKILDLFLPTQTLESEDAMRARIDDIETHVEFVSASLGSKDQQIARSTQETINALKKEQAYLTHLLNKKYLYELELCMIHPDTSREFSGIKAGDTVIVDGWINYKGYPLNVNDQKYFICRKEYIAAAVRK